MVFCAQCGTRMSDDARFCPSCGTPRADATAAPARPVSARPAPTPTPQPPMLPLEQTASAHALSEEMVLASIGQRAFAHLLDGIPVLLVFVVVGSIVANETGNMTGNGFEMQGEAALVTLVITYIIVLIYFTIFEALPAGKTFGKWLAGIRVASEIGRRASFGQAFMRNLLRLIDGLPLYLIGLALAGSSERKQRLGDRVAHTLVLRTGRIVHREKPVSTSPHDVRGEPVRP